MFILKTKIKVGNQIIKKIKVNNYDVLMKYFEVY